jgi:hypothetical protein
MISKFNQEKIIAFQICRCTARGVRRSRASRRSRHRALLILTIAGTLSPVPEGGWHFGAVNAMALSGSEQILKFVSYNHLKTRYNFLHYEYLDDKRPQPE